MSQPHGDLEVQQLVGHTLQTLDGLERGQTEAAGLEVLESAVFQRLDDDRDGIDVLVQALGDERVLDVAVLVGQQIGRASCRERV